MEKDKKNNKPPGAQSLTFTNHEWIAACGHELRIPIAQIENCTEILDIDSHEPFLNNAERKQYIADLKSANRSMSLLVEDLIDGAKNANHSFKINNQTIDLKAIIEQVHHTFSPSTKHNVTLLLDYHENAPTLAMADPERIKQVISNMIRNAIKFTSSGKITITVENEPEKSNFIRVSIIDTGVGMDSQQVQRVWDAFTKVYDVSMETDDEINKGLGLGLALSSNFITGMGGTIGVESTPKVGSKFYFTIPAYEKI